MLVLYSHEPEEQNFHRMKANAGIFDAIFGRAVPFLDAKKDTALIEQLGILEEYGWMPTIVLKELPKDQRRRLYDAIKIVLKRLEDPAAHDIFLDDVSCRIIRIKGHDMLEVFEKSGVLEEP